MKVKFNLLPYPRKTVLEQVLWAVLDTETYYGNKKQFDARKSESVKWLTEMIEHRKLYDR